MIERDFRRIVGEAAAMQDRFTIQTRNQLKVTNRLTAQRNALEELCEKVISAVEEQGETAADTLLAWRKELNEARSADPDEADTQ